MDELTLLARYAKDHGMTYGELQMQLYAGRITYEQIGINRQIKERKKKKERKKWERTEH